MAETLRKNAEPPRFTYGDYVSGRTAGEGTWGPAIFPELQIRWKRVYESL